MNFAYCLHIALAIGKHTDVFREDFFWLDWGSPALFKKQSEINLKDEVFSAENKE